MLKSIITVRLISAVVLCLFTADSIAFASPCDVISTKNNILAAQSVFNPIEEAGVAREGLKKVEYEILIGTRLILSGKHPMIVNSCLDDMYEIAKKDLGGRGESNRQDVREFKRRVNFLDYIERLAPDRMKTRISVNGKEFEIDYSNAVPERELSPNGILQYADVFRKGDRVNVRRVDSRETALLRSSTFYDALMKSLYYLSPVTMPHYISNGRNVSMPLLMHNVKNELAKDAFGTLVAMSDPDGQDRDKFKIIDYTDLMASYRTSTNDFRASLTGKKMYVYNYRVAADSYAMQDSIDLFIALKESMISGSGSLVSLMVASPEPFEFVDIMERMIKEKIYPDDREGATTLWSFPFYVSFTGTSLEQCELVGSRLTVALQKSIPMRPMIGTDELMNAAISGNVSYGTKINIVSRGRSNLPPGVDSRSEEGLHDRVSGVSYDGEPVDRTRERSAAKRLAYYSGMNGDKLIRMLEVKLNRKLSQKERREARTLIGYFGKIRDKARVVPRLNEMLKNGGHPNLCVQVCDQAAELFKRRNIPYATFRKYNFINGTSTLFPYDERIDRLWADQDANTPLHIYTVFNLFGVPCILDLSADQFVRSSGAVGAYKDIGVVIIPADELEGYDWPYVGGRMPRPEYYRMLLREFVKGPRGKTIAELLTRPDLDEYNATMHARAPMPASRIDIEERGPQPTIHGLDPRRVSGMHNAVLPDLAALSPEEVLAEISLKDTPYTMEETYNYLTMVERRISGKGIPPPSKTFSIIKMFKGADKAAWHLINIAKATHYLLQCKNMFRDKNANILADEIKNKIPLSVRTNTSQECLVMHPIYTYFHESYDIIDWDHFNDAIKVIYSYRILENPPAIAKPQTAQKSHQSLAASEDLRLGSEHRDEEAALLAARAYLKWHPVNMRIDLSAIPNIEGELDRTMVEFARRIAWYHASGLQIQYILEGARQGEALMMLKAAITNLGSLPGIDVTALLTCVEQKPFIKEAAGSEPIEISLKTIDAVQAMQNDASVELSDKQFVVGLKDDESIEGVPIPNYGSASSIGLSLAALRVAKSRSDADYAEARRKLLPRLHDIFDRAGILKDGIDFTDETLDSFLNARTHEKIAHAILYALPPALKVVIEKLRSAHDRIQLFLQSA